MQRKTDEASALHKRLHHLALESRSGRDKAQAYASSLSPGGLLSTPGGSSMGVSGRTPGSREPKTPGGGSLRGLLRTPGGVPMMPLDTDLAEDQTPNRIRGQDRGPGAHSRQTPKTHGKRRGGSLGGSRLQSSQSNLQVGP